MKTILFTASLFYMSLLLPSSVMAADACEVVLCLYGKATGNGGGNECQSAERSFFDVVKKTDTDFTPTVHPTPEKPYYSNANQPTRKLSIR